MKDYFIGGGDGVVLWQSCGIGETSGVPPGNGENEIMPRHRSYRLLCPIARALDKVGDRWSLLILRDLHAGPARFSDIQQGMPHLASNLLTSRLDQLQTGGLIERRATEYGANVYALTDHGEATAPLLFELAAFGTRWPPAEDTRRPGNMRTIAVTLKEALRRAVTKADGALSVELVVDDEPFAIAVADGAVEVRYQENLGASLSIATNYDAMIGVGDGDITPAEFGNKHIEIRRGSRTATKQFFALLSRAFNRSD